MQDLIALAQLISRQKIKDVKVFNCSTEQPNKQYQLYQGILDKKIKNDEDAIHIIYAGKVNRRNLEMLKIRLKQKLMNTVFFIDLNKSSFTDYSKSKVTVYKQWSIINILLNRSLRPIAIDICESAFSHSQKYGFTDLEILLSRILMHHYGYLDINIKKHKKYTDILFTKLKVLEMELITEKYFTEISQEYIRWKSPNYKSLKHKLNRYCEELSGFESQCKTYTLCFYYYRLLSFKYILEKEYVQAKEACKKGLHFFTEKNFRTPNAEFLFRHDLHYCHSQVGEFEKAISLIRANIKLAIPNKYNWFREWLSYFTWAVQTTNYNEMLLATSTVISRKELKNHTQLNEQWSINEAYLNLFVLLGKVDENMLKKHKLKPFRLNKFLNNVPSYSKDKKGLNVSILIAHLIHLLVLKKYDEILNRIDAMRQYAHRYLKNDTTLRSNCFIKMLCKIPDANYHPVALERHTTKLYQKLSTTAYTYSDNPAEIEVIPYENLWEIVLEILVKNQK